jgi:hypothetical protein
MRDTRVRRFVCDVISNLCCGVSVDHLRLFLSLGVDVDVKLGQKRSRGVAEDRPTITCFLSSMKFGRHPKTLGEGEGGT